MLAIMTNPSVWRLLLLPVSQHLSFPVSSAVSVQSDSILSVPVCSDRKAGCISFLPSPPDISLHISRNLRNGKCNPFLLFCDLLHFFFPFFVFFASSVAEGLPLLAIFTRAWWSHQYGHSSVSTFIYPVC